MLTPFVERSATEEERKAGVISPEVLNRMAAEVHRGFRDRRGHYVRCGLLLSRH
jgi:predicted secreted protein